MHSAAVLDLEKVQKQVKGGRFDSLDLLRGIVLILMALDHSRHYFSYVDDPLNLSATTPLLFFTRWVTHYCAPIFIFLAGISACLFEQRTACTKRELFWYLFTRGLWFMFFELTFNFGLWTFFLVPFQFSLQIFWAIGTAMIFLSLLIFLPRWLILTICLALITGHNYFDQITTESFGHWSWLWHLLHVNGDFYLWNNMRVHEFYPMVPWMGVMGLGYVLGPVMQWSQQQRSQFFIRMGVSFCGAFLALRFLNIYGDPHAWIPQHNSLYTIMSFVNCEKYPPSLLYLLMTLGPALIFLGWVKDEFCHLPLSRIAITFGRVPFFFYVLHVPMIFGLALCDMYFQGGASAIQLYITKKMMFGYELPVIYLVWLSVLSVLYFPCLWYSQFKSRHRYAVLSYL